MLTKTSSELLIFLTPLPPFYRKPKLCGLLPKKADWWSLIFCMIFLH